MTPLRFIDKYWKLGVFWAMKLDILKEGGSQAAFTSRNIVILSNSHPFCFLFRLKKQSNALPFFSKLSSLIFLNWWFGLVMGIATWGYSDSNPKPPGPKPPIYHLLKKVTPPWVVSLGFLPREFIFSFPRGRRSIH